MTVFVYHVYVLDIFYYNWANIVCLSVCNPYSSLIFGSILPKLSQDIQRLREGAKFGPNWIKFGLDLVQYCNEHQFKPLFPKQPRI